ncbi:hypothetical protein D3C84_747760 [compost metagenome]
MGLYLVVEITQGPDNLVLKRRVWSLAGFFGDFQFACFRVLEEVFQGSYAVFRRGIDVQLITAEVTEHAHRQLGPRDQNVESTMPTIFIERAKFTGDTTGFISAVTNADEDHVALITLNVFEVFYEERFAALCGEKHFGLRCLTPQQLDLDTDQIPLGDTECSHPQGKFRRLQRMLHHREGDRLGFFLVGASATTVIQRVGQIIEAHTLGVEMLTSRGKHHQFAVVELDVGDSDQ